MWSSLGKSLTIQGWYETQISTGSPRNSDWRFSCFLPLSSRQLRDYTALSHIPHNSWTPVILPDLNRWSKPDQWIQSHQINWLIKKEEMQTVLEPTFAVEWRVVSFCVCECDWWMWRCYLKNSKVRSQLKKKLLYITTGLWPPVSNKASVLHSPQIPEIIISELHI
jgi:hypothetical protein